MFRFSVVSDVLISFPSISLGCPVCQLLDLSDFPVFQIFTFSRYLICYKGSVFRRFKRFRLFIFRIVILFRWLSFSKVSDFICCLFQMFRCSGILISKNVVFQLVYLFKYSDFLIDPDLQSFQTFRVSNISLPSLRFRTF